MRLEEKEMLSVTEVAKLMGISRTHVIRLINSGQISATRVGRSFIIKKSDMPGIFRKISDKDKKEIERAVDKTFGDYAEVIRKLGKT